MFRAHRGLIKEEAQSASSIVSLSVAKKLLRRRVASVQSKINCSKIKHCFKSQQLIFADCLNAPCPCSFLDLGLTSRWTRVFLFVFNNSSKLEHYDLKDSRQHFQGFLIDSIRLINPHGQFATSLVFAKHKVQLTYGS